MQDADKTEIGSKIFDYNEQMCYIILRFHIHKDFKMDKTLIIVYLSSKDLGKVRRKNTCF